MERANLRSPTPRLPSPDLGLGIAAGQVLDELGERVLGGAYVSAMAIAPGA